MHYPGAEALVFELREPFALDPSIFLEIVVKPLDLNGGQLVQRDGSDSGNDVALDVVLVVQFRVGTDAGFSVDLVPSPHP